MEYMGSCENGHVPFRWDPLGSIGIHQPRLLDDGKGMQADAVDETKLPQRKRSEKKLDIDRY